MVILPEDFIATDYPGYYWSLTDQHLYSIKSGELKPLKKLNNWWTGRDVFTGWTVSVHGKKRYLSEDHLHWLERQYKRRPKELQVETVSVWRVIGQSFTNFFRALS